MRLGVFFKRGAMRSTYRQCKFCGDFHDVENWPDNHREWIPDVRSELPAPFVVQDEMRPLEGQHDGNIYTSKRAIRKSYREHGVTEVGTESPVLRKPVRDTSKQVRAAVQSAASKIRLTTPTYNTKGKRA